MTQSDFETKRLAKATEAKKRRLRRFGLVILVWIFVAIYFLTPLSKVGTPKIRGNIYFSRNQLVTDSGLDKKKNVFIWDIKPKAAKELLLSSNPNFISSVKIWQGLNGITIEIVEIFPVATDGTIFLLSNGVYLDIYGLIPRQYAHLNDSNNQVLSHVPLLENIETLEADELATALKNGNLEITNNYLKKITAIDDKAQLTIEDSRIKNDFNSTVKVVFENISEISIFLNLISYLEGIDIFNNNSNRQDFRFLGGRVL